MANLKSVYTGCLLGLAVGDALGATVDSKSYEDICRDYGPAGLLGYDLVNGFAQISSHTQVAAFACNGLLIGTARGQKDLLGCIRGALREWARTVHLPRDPEKRSCWLSKVSSLRQRRCLDARTLDSFTRNVLGTLEHPANQANGAGTLTAVVPVGLYFQPEHMAVDQIGLLAARVVAMTHGDPHAFLTGAVLAYAIAGIVQDEAMPLAQQFSHAVAAVEAQFSGEYPQTAKVAQAVRNAIALSAHPQVSRVEAMKKLVCMDAQDVLAGAVYAVLADGGDFDYAMVTAVNHSGRSAAVGALAGAILGAKLTDEGIPEFYLECLEPCAVLRELGADFFNSLPGRLQSRLFDDNWDRKYAHGMPVDPDGWEEAT